MDTKKEFFDSISLFYDEMIGFERSLMNRTRIYKRIIKPEFKTALDFGCGTGLDSIALCKNGLKITALDISSAMIEIARKNAQKNNCSIDFHRSGIESISKKSYKSFDLVVSMGNTIANLRPLMLRKTVRIVHDMLKKGGMFLIQVLNFDKIIKEGKRIIKISKIPNEYVVRFYDIHLHYLNFNILKFNSSNTNKYELQTTYLYPYSKSRMVNILHKAGFRKISTYGDLHMEKFNVKESNDLIIAAYK